MSAQPPVGQTCAKCNKAPATTWALQKVARKTVKIPVCPACRH